MPTLEEGRLPAPQYKDDLEADHGKPEESLIAHNSSLRRPRTRTWSTMWWLVAVLVAVCGLFALSRTIPRNHSPSTEQDADIANEASKVDLAAEVPVAAPAPIPTTLSAPLVKVEPSSVKATFATDMHASIEGAVLGPGRQIIYSPSQRWRTRLTDEGDLVVEEVVPSKNITIHWWANSAGYKRAKQTNIQRFVVVDAHGHASAVTTAQESHVGWPGPSREVLWTSEGHRACDVKFNGQTLKYQLDQHAPSQSISIDDTGRLITWDDSGAPKCIIYGGAMNTTLPLLNEIVDLKTTEEPAIPVGKKHVWPSYRKSSHLTNRQLRAWLEKDVAAINKSIELDETQMATIYDTAIVIPSYHGHLDFVTNFLRSMIRHCVDCDKWQMNLILAQADVEMFRNAIFKPVGSDPDSISRWLPGLRIVIYEKMLFEHYAPDVDVAGVTQQQHKIILQDFKKMYGCFVTGKRFCSLFDSEGIFIRTSWYADIVRGFLDDPFVVHNPEDRNGKTMTINWSTPAKDILDIPRFSDAGWLLGYFNWIFDASVYNSVAKIVATKYPNALIPYQGIFSEILYYAYVWAKKGPVPGPEYRFITAKEMLGDRLFSFMWDKRVETVEGADNGQDIMEDMRFWVEWYPEMLVPAARKWDEHGLALWHPSDKDWAKGMLFMQIAKSIQICVSEQPMELYEEAMFGTFNENGYRGYQPKPEEILERH